MVYVYKKKHLENELFKVVLQSYLTVKVLTTTYLLKPSQTPCVSQQTKQGPYPRHLAPQKHKDLLHVCMPQTYVPISSCMCPNRCVYQSCLPGVSEIHH